MPISSRQSLAVKIPLLMSTLLLLALAGMSAASYVELRASLIDAATGRLHRAADQMANAFGLSAGQRIAEMRQLIARAEIHEYLRTRDAALIPKLRAAIEQHLGATVTLGDVELWDPDGKRIYAAGAELEELTGPTLDEYKREFSAGRQPAIGKLRMFEDGLRFAAGGLVVEGDEVLGFVVERRRISNPTQTIQMVAILTGLIGNEATMVIGNTDGSIWSDLMTTIEDLPITGGGTAAVGLPARRQAPDHRVGDTGCAVTVDRSDRVSARRRA